MYYSAFGWAGTTITCVYKIPQIYKFYKSKTSQGVSLLSYLIQTSGCVLYAIHGIIIEDNPIFIMGTVSFFLNIILCCQCVYYSKHDNRIINNVDNDADNDANNDP
jgi:MtN3 and saliva related transmembrane protein